ncbi:TraX family protein [Herbinix luporum]|jgi:hypothetical protein|uniref:Putative membrane protein n=1 Tax=Herbinix luporum TaxID=1679721 RepID=A0A0K8J6X3_9FIRM|nr:TraX family protein [Herbinix luporum]MDI9488756.1 TraX family protein [Bacillota bacterium]CUH93376.1 putative membrane protein [Herbinix luporum]
MSTFALKLIAIISMLIDHVSYVFLREYSLLYAGGRLIGRLALPIFVFLLVEGFFHTRNIKKYLIRLGIFALISEIPFDLAFYNTYFYFGHQNIFFTLFIGLLSIYLINMVEKRYKNNMLIVNLLNAGITIALSIVAAILRTDYRFMGVLLIVAFYLFRGSKPLLIISLIILSPNVVQAFSVLSLIPISFYNGKKGKDIKYFFYAFYPAHLLILYLLNLII